jgi:actin-related protein 2
MFFSDHSIILQVGYAGQNFPSFIYPSMVGRPILRAEEVCVVLFGNYYALIFYIQAVSETLELKEVMCGDEAAAVRHSLEIRYPVCAHRHFNYLCN